MTTAVTDRDAGADRAAWVPSSSGRGLPEHLRQDWESLLGADLRAVRIHDGADASQLAREQGAHAYAIGDDIVVDTDAGDDERRVAHEVIHVVQQRGNPIVGRDAHARADREADRASTDLVRGRRPGAIGGAPRDAPLRDAVPASATEVAFEDRIVALLERRIRRGDDATALARAGELREVLGQLDAHDSMVLHGRLLGDEPIARLFRGRLATATRRRLLEQLLRQSRRGGEPPVEEPDEMRTFLGGVSIRGPGWPVLVDPLEHPDESIVLDVLASAPMPADAELYAEITVECVPFGGTGAFEVMHFEYPWLPGMSAGLTYDVSWTQTGRHYVTLRLRDGVGDVVHVARAQYEVTTAIPQDLATLQIHPQYIDSFQSVNYDPDFRPDQRGHLSYWVGLQFPDGMSYLDTRTVFDTTTQRSPTFGWRDGRIVPTEMNPTTTPHLVAAKEAVAAWMDEYNTLFIIGAFVSGVMPILMEVPFSVGPMPAPSRMPAVPRIRPRPPHPPVVAPRAPGGGPGTAGTVEVSVGRSHTIVDSDVAIALDRAHAGMPLQGTPTATSPARGQALAAETLRAEQVVVTRTTVRELSDPAHGGAHATIPVARTGTAAAGEREAIVATLTRHNVGGSKGAADREVIADALLAATEPGVTPVLATMDRQVINSLADMAGIPVRRGLGRYANVAEFLFHARGGARTFAVTINGRVLVVRPIQTVRTTL